MNPSVRPWLRLEGAAVFLAAIVLYQLYGNYAGWTFFVLLFFVPDISILGYLAGPRVGAAAYNLAHTYAVPAMLGLGGVLTMPLLFNIALVWTAHIGFDRALGYGLKLPTDFRDTHLGRIGRAR